MKRTIRMLGLAGLILFGAVLPLQAQSMSITKGPFRDGNLGLSLGDMAGFKFEKGTFYFDLEKGYLVQYRPPHGGRLCVSVYPVGKESVAEGGDSPRLLEEVRDIREALQQRVSEGALSEVRTVNDKVITIGSDAAAVRFRSATSSIRAGGENLIFQHYLTVYRDRIVSIRLAQTEPSTADSEIAFQRFLLEFSQKLTALKTVRNVHHTRK